jgi:uncharacterized damage-inducible protein DinB
MNLAYFKKLFDYDFWANERCLTSWAATMAPPEEAVQKMSHVLLAKNVWMARLMDMPSSALTGVLSIEAARELNTELKNRMVIYLSKLDEKQLSERVAYQNTQGAGYQTVLSDILAHIVNHGSYHRGQIALLLKKAGGPPTHVDYIGYVREEDAKR